MAGVPGALALGPLAQPLAHILSGVATVAHGTITVTVERGVPPRGGTLRVVVSCQPADPANLQAHCLNVGEASGAAREVDAFASALRLQGIYAVHHPSPTGGSSWPQVRWQQIEPAAVHAQKVAQAMTGPPPGQARGGDATATSP